jgi:hypothetical protein
MSQVFIQFVMTAVDKFLTGQSNREIDSVKQKEMSLSNWFES